MPDETESFHYSEEFFDATRAMNPKAPKPGGLDWMALSAKRAEQKPRNFLPVINQFAPGEGTALAKVQGMALSRQLRHRTARPQAMSLINYSAIVSPTRRRIERERKILLGFDSSRFRKAWP